MNKTRKGKKISYINCIGQQIQKYSWICAECGLEWERQSDAKLCTHVETRLHHFNDGETRAIGGNLNDNS